MCAYIYARGSKRVKNRNLTMPFLILLDDGLEHQPSLLSSNVSCLWLLYRC